MSEPKYCRVYWSIRSDPKFAGVYHDDAALATWLRLLITADAIWPEPADIPGRTRQRPFRQLVDAGLLDDLGNGLYRVHGLDRERGERSEKARTSVAARYDRSTTVVRPNNDRTTSRAEQSKDEQSRADARDPEWLVAWFQTGRAYLPTERQRTLIDAYLRAFDVTGDARLAGVFLSNPADPIAALKADLAAFRAERSSQAAAQETPRPARRSGSGLTGVTAELAKLLREGDAA